MKYIQTNKTGRLSYRRGIPVHLRPFVTRRPRELVRSLSGKALSEPGVLDRYHEAHREYEATIARAERLASGATSALTPEDIPVLVASYARTLLRSIRDTHFDEADTNRDWLWSPSWRYMPYAFWDEATAAEQEQALPSRADRIRTLAPELASVWRKAIADGDRAAVIEIEGQNADELMADAGLSATDGSDLHFQLCHRLLQADIDVLERLMAQYTTGTMVEVPEAPEAPVTAPAPAPATSTKPMAQTLPEIAEALMASTVSPVSQATRNAWNTALRYWTDVHGVVTCDEVTRTHVTQWLAVIAQRPAQLPRNLHGVPLPEVLTMYQGKDEKLIEGRTIIKHLSSLSSIWNKAVRRGDIAGNMPNPFTNHEVEIVRKTGGDELTVAELNAVLSLPVFTEHARPNGCKGEAAYWLPLLLLFTGCRPGEAAQLTTADFTRDDSGRLLIRFTDEGDHPAIGPRRLKTSKRGTGKRTFPVPQALLDLGLEDYLTWLERDGEKALFPKLTASVKGLAEGWSRWWGPYVRAAGAIPADKRQAREFRHGFATAARASGVSADALSYIQGHVATGTNAKYGSNAPLGFEIEKVTYRGMKLTQVARWRPPVT